MQDPTLIEMREYLDSLVDVSERTDIGYEFDREAAIYWFAAHYHGGQQTNLYSALSQSEFNPSPIARGPEPNPTEESFYAELEDHFA